MTAFSAVRLLLLCAKKNLKPPKLSFFLSFSTNGGRTWTHVPVSRFDQIGVEPVSATIGWGVNGEGQVLRTTDGGHSWRTVWPYGPGGSHGTLEGLAASGPSTAFGTFAVDTSKGTDFVIRQTTDAGSKWHSIATLRLP